MYSYTLFNVFFQPEINETNTLIYMIYSSFCSAMTSQFILIFADKNHQWLKGTCQSDMTSTGVAITQNVCVHDSCEDVEN